MTTLLELFAKIAAVWITLGVGGLLALGFLILGWYLPQFRQFFFGCAVACAIATLAVGYGVKLEAAVMAARDARAEELRKERDAAQAQLAAADAKARTSALAVLNKKESAKESRYEKSLKASPGCVLSPADLAH